MLVRWFTNIAVTESYEIDAPRPNATPFNSKAIPALYDVCPYFIAETFEIDKLLESFEQYASIFAWKDTPVTPSVMVTTLLIACPAAPKRSTTLVISLLQ